MVGGRAALSGWLPESPQCQCASEGLDGVRSGLGDGRRQGICRGGCSVESGEKYRGRNRRGGGGGGGRGACGQAATGPMKETWGEAIIRFLSGKCVGDGGRGALQSG